MVGTGMPPIGTGTGGGGGGSGGNGTVTLPGVPGPSSTSTGTGTAPIHSGAAAAYGAAGWGVMGAVLGGVMLL